MAKKSIVERNNNRKKLYNQYKKKREELKSKIYNKNISLSERFELVVELAKLPRNSSKVRIRNRCEQTGRGRGVYRTFNLSRNEIRRLAGKGLLPGVTKSSW